jgi:hypothetical protein
LSAFVSKCKVAEQGCQIFLGTKYQNGEKLPQNITKGYKCSQNRPDVQYIHQHLTLQNVIKIPIFGLKINHLATLLPNVSATLTHGCNIAATLTRESKFFYLTDQQGCQIFSVHDTKTGKKCTK